MDSTRAALSHAQAKRAYGRLAGIWPLVSRYEDRAVAELLQHGAFSQARAVYEFGCGNGRLAERLLAAHLPSHAWYQGVDITPEMVDRAIDRLVRFGPRAQVTLSDGGPPSGYTPASMDRFVSCFVLDLLPEAEIRAVLHAAHEMLGEDGLLCLASLADGESGASRRIMQAWRAVYGWAPALLGGCRPLALEDFLPAAAWQVCHRCVVRPLGIPLEVVIAQKVGGRD